MDSSTRNGRPAVGTRRSIAWRWAVPKVSLAWRNTAVFGLALLADLGHGQRGGGIKSADDAVHAVIDDSLALIARDIRVGFDIDVDKIDLVAVVGQHLGGDEGAAVATLAGRRQVAGARQEDRDLEDLCLGAHDRRGESQRTRGG